MENYFNLLIHLPTYSLTTADDVALGASTDLVDSFALLYPSLFVWANGLIPTLFLAYIKAGKDKSECFCNDATCFKNSQSLNCISFDISDWFEDGILTRARSKLLLCSWKAAEVFSAKRIKRESIVKKKNQAKRDRVVVCVLMLVGVSKRAFHGSLPL